MSPPAVELLRIHGAAFGYEGRPILSGVDLAIVPGDFLGIVGPNGAGKTTLFRGILGLLEPLAGAVEARTRAIGYVPQREGLDPIFPLRVDEVVRMGAYARLTSLRRVRAEDRIHVRTCLERLEIADLSRAVFASLSGGQRQRVLIARALMTRPALLLLDEPTTGVDRAARQVILELLRELSERERLAVLVVSHEFALLREVAKEVLWVAEGRVERHPAADLLQARNLDRLFALEGAEAAE